LITPCTIWSASTFDDGDRPRKGQRGKRDRLEHRQYLGHHENPVPIPPVDEHSGERSKQKCGNLAKESYDAEQKYRVREAIDEPAGGDARDPRTNERYGLTTEEEPVVPVLEGAG